MSFMKYGDGKIESVFDEEELSDKQKKAIKDLSEKRVKISHDNSELKDKIMGDN